VAIVAALWNVGVIYKGVDWDVRLRDWKIACWTGLKKSNHNFMANHIGQEFKAIFYLAQGAVTP
jgi:hypothetical protein